jgi:hypothetical protein
MPIRTFLTTLYPIYIYILWVAFLVNYARLLRDNTLGPFKLNLVNGLMQLNSESGPLCCVLERLTSP